MENINNTENKRYDNFVNIHGHSYYSLLDGQGSPEAIVDKTLELGQPASCITDHGVMFSIVDHFNYAKEKGQKAIAGFEAYVVNNHKEKSNENGNKDRKSTRLNSSHANISYAVFCLKKKKAHSLIESYNH